MACCCFIVIYQPRIAPFACFARNYTKACWRACRDLRAYKESVHTLPAPQPSPTPLPPPPPTPSHPLHAASNGGGRPIASEINGEGRFPEAFTLSLAQFMHRGAWKSTQSRTKPILLFGLQNILLYSR